MKPLSPNESVRSVTFLITGAVEIATFPDYSHSMRPGKVRVTVSMEDLEGYSCDPRITKVEVVEVDDGK